MEILKLPSSRPKALERALVDIEQGRLWMARDRLGCYLKSNPLHQAVRDLYGEVLFRMGDLPMAGRAWYLTDRDDEAARSSIAAFEGVFHNPVVRALAVGRGLEGPELPPAANARVVQLKDQLPAGFALPRQTGERTPPDSTLSVTARALAVMFVVALILIAIAAVGLGLFQIGRFIVEWLGGLLSR